jgi:hypothetical protein
MRVVPLLLLALVFSSGPVAAQQVKSIKPGMSKAEVRAAWGKPLTSRTAGEYAYLFYDNGCAQSCGTYDVVILQGGQVVDVIARGRNHQYDGISSSPADRAPHYTPPGDTTQRSQ